MGVHAWGVLRVCRLGLLPQTPLVWPRRRPPPPPPPGWHTIKQRGCRPPHRTLAREIHNAPSLQGSSRFVSHDPVYRSGLLDEQDGQASVQKPLNGRRWHHMARDPGALLGVLFSLLHTLPPARSLSHTRGLQMVHAEPAVLEGRWTASRVPEALSWEGSFDIRQSSPDKAPLISDSPQPHCSNTILPHPHSPELPGERLLCTEGNMPHRRQRV